MATPREAARQRQPRQRRRCSERGDFDEYLSMIGPKIGASFVSIARALITSDIRAKLVALKDFEYTDPGMGYPAWKLAAVNRCKDRMIADILA